MKFVGITRFRTFTGMSLKIPQDFMEDLSTSCKRELVNSMVISPFPILLYIEYVKMLTLAPKPQKEFLINISSCPIKQGIVNMIIFCSLEDISQVPTVDNI